jgi:hypothetical protein
LASTLFWPNKLFQIISTALKQVQQQYQEDDEHEQVYLPVALLGLPGTSLQCHTPGLKLNNLKLA